VTVHATVHRHDQVRAGAADDLAQRIVGTEHRHVGRRLGVEPGTRRKDHAVHGDLVGAA